MPAYGLYSVQPDNTALQTLNDSRWLRMDKLTSPETPGVWIGGLINLPDTFLVHLFCWSGCLFIDFDQLSKTAREAGQAHLFAYWEVLDQPQREALLADVARIDFALVGDLIAEHLDPTAEAKPPVDLRPPPCKPANSRSPEERERYASAVQCGKDLVSAGKVAAMVVAGGQGTRLGFDGPKGAFPASPIKHKPLFQLFAESLLAAERRFGHQVRWYVMTSPDNDAQTKRFFDAHGHFGLDPEQVFFFTQGVMPAVDQDGHILLAKKHRVALSPDGHGGTIRALAASGALSDMASNGVELLSYFQVDNPLVKPIDPLLLGLHQESKSQASSLTIGKAFDEEPVGVFALVGGKLSVVEYSDLPAELAVVKNADGTRTYDAANIAVHVLSQSFLELLTRAGSDVSLPWHRAKKIVPHIDIVTGKMVEPTQPNAFKFEMFVFDTLPLAKNPLLLQSTRGEVFSPIKNATGADSPETSRQDQSSRAARWLEDCGVEIPRTTSGDPDCTVEISPILAMDAADLKSGSTDYPTIAPGSQTYLE